MTCGPEKSTNPGWCPTHWDNLLCWKSSKPGTRVYQACFKELNGLKYDTTLNASRLCKLNGIWENASDYMKCRPLDTPNYPDPSVVYTSYFYCIGYAISLVALVAAVSIFVYFKDLRCLRNTIHTNLMCTYILSDFTWIILTSALQEALTVSHYACVLLSFSIHYFVLTNFFWMFVEGLYLYILVVETFTRENIKLRVYLFIGWGVPLIVMIIWGVARKIDAIEDVDSDACLWLTSHPVHDWIYQGPAISVLIVNLIFLSKIMWVLITKLRSANSAETQQYRKASKALLVLIPLLGVTYVLTMVGPTESGTYANYYSYGRAILLSMQGFMVAIFYCFVNSEVKNTFKHHFLRWNDARNLRTRGSRRYAYSKDWSPNTRTESVRPSVHIGEEKTAGCA